MKQLSMIVAAMAICFSVSSCSGKKQESAQEEPVAIETVENELQEMAEVEEVVVDSLVDVVEEGTALEVNVGETIEQE